MSTALFPFFDRSSGRFFPFWQAQKGKKWGLGRSPSPAGDGTCPAPWRRANPATWRRGSSVCAQKNSAPVGALLCFCHSGESGGDDGHLVDLVGVAAAGEVVDGGVQTLQDGAVSGEAAQTLGDLVADVAGFDAGEDEGVGVAGHGGAGELELADLGGDGSVELHLAVDGDVGSHFLGDGGGVTAQTHGSALAGALGGEGENGHLGVDAEDLGGLGGLHDHLGQLLGGGLGHVAFLVHAVLVADVDGAVAHGQQLFVALQNEAGGDEGGAGLGLDELQSGTHGVGGGVGGAAQQGVGLAHLHQHGAEVVALLEVGAALVGGHLALTQSDHGVDHLVHAFVGQGVDDLHAGEVIAQLLGLGVELFLGADQHGGEETVGLQAGSSLHDTGIGAVGKDDLAGVRFQDLNKLIEHFVFLQLENVAIRFFPII